MQYLLLKEANCVVQNIRCKTYTNALRPTQNGRNLVDKIFVFLMKIVVFWFTFHRNVLIDAWWRHQMETFSALLALGAGI